MTHATATRAEWRAARIELLQKEKEHTRRGDELTRLRQELPWVRVEKEYRFDTEDGPATLADLFGGRSQLLLYQFMFGPDYSAGCPACSAIADGFNGPHVHLQNHDVMLMAVSRAPLDAILDYRQRMGWTFPWVSSFHTDYNYDYTGSMSEEEQASGTSDYNFREEDTTWVREAPGSVAEMAGAAAPTSRPTSASGPA